MHGNEVSTTSWRWPIEVARYDVQNACSTHWPAHAQTRWLPGACVFGGRLLVHHVRGSPRGPAQRISLGHHRSRAACVIAASRRHHAPTLWADSNELSALYFFRRSDEKKRSAFAGSPGNRFERPNLFLSPAATTHVIFLRSRGAHRRAGDGVPGGDDDV